MSSCLHVLLVADDEMIAVVVMTDEVILYDGTHPSGLSVPPMPFVNFLIKAFLSPDQCFYRKIRMFEGFWKKKILKKFISRVVTEILFSK